MGDIIIARLISGHLVIGEKTRVGLKFPCIASATPNGFLFMDWFSALTKKGREDSKKVEILESHIMGSVMEPIPELVTKYQEMRSGLSLPKKKLVEATSKNVN
jgi:hypothetical protein